MSRAVRFLFLAVLLALGPPAVAGAAAPASPHCVLQSRGEAWAGDCGVVAGRRIYVSISEEGGIQTGAWRTDRTPDQAYAGQIRNLVSPPEPIEIEIYADRSGVLRTGEAWRAIRGFEKTKDQIAFDLDMGEEPRPSDLDRQIILRAALILQNPAAWNRADNRVCRDGAVRWSLYCALARASVEVAGGFHHRRPALQLVRALVRERHGWRAYDHELMDYNNDPSTSLSAVQALLADAAARIKAQP